MFLDETPLYLPSDPLGKENNGVIQQTVILLPGEEKHYAPEDKVLISRLMSALGLAEGQYEVLYITSTRRISSAAHASGTLILNMGADWENAGIHAAIAPYQLRQVGQYYLLSSDLPSRLGKDSGLKKLLWNELMKVFSREA
jgi:hypothetical protein